LIRSLALLVALALPTAALAAPKGAPKAAAPDLQPEPPGVITPDRRVDVLHLDLDVTVDPAAGTVSGRTTHRVRPLREGLKEVVFHQVGLDVSAVRVNGLEVVHHLGAETLAIRLPDPPPPITTEFEIQIEYRATPRMGMHFRGPGPNSPDRWVEAWTQGEDTENRYWFPSWDDPSDRFTFAAAYTVPDGFTAVGNGVLTATEPKDGWTTFRWTMGEDRLVNYLVATAIGPYQSVESTWRGKPLVSYTGPDVPRRDLELAHAHLEPMLDRLSDITGVEYPWSSYKQVFVQRFLHGGMENTTITLMSINSLHAESWEPHRPRAAVIIAHELAHQWYGDLLTLQSWREMWLNEGFAEFFEARTTEHIGGPYVGAAATLRRLDRTISGDKRRPRPMVPTFFNGGAKIGRADPYARGGTVLQMLRSLLGDEAFWRGIAAYTTGHRDSLVETVDLRRAMEDASGRDLRWFFDQWVYLPGHAQLAVTHRVDAEAKTVRVDVAQKQDASGLVPIYVLPVDVEIATTEGTRTERFVVDGVTGGATFPLDGELLYVTLDPQAALLATWTTDLSGAQQAALLVGSTPAARLRTLRAIPDSKGKPAAELQSAVLTLLADAEQPLELRRSAGAAAVHWKDEASVAAHLAATAGATGLLQEHLVRQTAKLERSDAVVELLAGIVKSAAVPDLAGAALASLASLEGEDVRARLMPILRGKPGDGGLLSAAISALGTHGRPDDLGAIERYLTGAWPGRVRTTAWAAASSLAGKADSGDARDDARARVARALETALDDPSIRTRQYLVSMLGRVGDRDTVKALQAAQARETWPRLVTSIDSAMEAIRTRKEAAADPQDGELKAKLEGLLERLDRAEKQLKTLEERW